jgi:undecaprenyl phosphate-alpha-L-ara4N flippase subunit ArnE
MTPQMLALCVIFALSIAGGQILFKYAALSWSAADKSQNLLLALLSPPLVCALALYGASAFLWIYILKSAPLSKAYAISMAGSALVPLAAWLIFGEAVGLQYWVGFVLMLTGVYLCIS